METRFENMYGVSATSMSKMMIEQLQIALKLFQFNPLVEQIDGVFSNRLMKVLQNFQQFVNSTKMTKEKKLPENGYLNVDTWESLKSLILKYRDQLNELGFITRGNPFQNIGNFSNSIKLFQVKKKLKEK